MLRKFAIFENYMMCKIRCQKDVRVMDERSSFLLFHPLNEKRFRHTIFMENKLCTRLSARVLKLPGIVEFAS